MTAPAVDDVARALSGTDRAKLMALAGSEAATPAEALELLFYKVVYWQPVREFCCEFFDTLPSDSRVPEAAFALAALGCKLNVPDVLTLALLAGLPVPVPATPDQVTEWQIWGPFVRALVAVLDDRDRIILGGDLAVDVLRTMDAHHTFEAIVDDWIVRENLSGSTSRHAGELRWAARALAALGREITIEAVSEMAGQALFAELVASTPAGVVRLTAACPPCGHCDRCGADQLARLNVHQQRDGLHGEG